MPCEYVSTSVFETFKDKDTLKKALERVRHLWGRFRLIGDTSIDADDEETAGLIKQAYQIEAAKAKAKKQGFFVSEKFNRDTGTIKLTLSR